VKILVVEDEPALLKGLVDLLGAAGHKVESVTDGLAATRRGLEPAFELVILDLMLPKIDGIEVCRRLKRARPTLPILMLTARGAEEDKVKGLKSGADDYVTKPFGPKELLARIEAIERRAKAAPADAEIIDCGDVQFDLGLCRMVRGPDSVSLTPRETGIIRWLYRHRARAVSRAELLEQVWGARTDMETRTVDMTIANLRHKIEADPENPRFVVSVKGVGYAWAAKPA